MSDEEIPEEYQDLELGTREDALADSSNTERVYIEADDKLYWFDLKEMSWEKQGKLVDKNLSVDDRSGDMDLDLQGYYRDVMEYKIEDMSVDGSVSIFLKGMGPELGGKLSSKMPDPGMGDVEEEEEKK